MARLQHVGNTMTEYSLIAASIAVVAIGSLTMFGHSLSGLYSTIEQAANKNGTLDVLAPTSSGNALQADQNGVTQARTGNAQAFSKLSKFSVASNSAPQEQPSFDMQTGTSSNATSVDGNSAMNTINQNVTLMKQLKQILAESKNPALQFWGASLLKRMQWLTASEGYATGIPDFQKLIKSPTYSQATAVQDILTYQQEMNLMMQGSAPDMWVPPKPSNVSPATWDKINAIVGQVSDNAKNLAVQVAPTNNFGNPLTAWVGQYNSVVSNDTIIQSTIQSTLQNGTLRRNSIVQDTAQKTNQTETLPGVLP